MRPESRVRAELPLSCFLRWSESDAVTSRNLSPEAGIQDQSRGVGNIKSGYFDSRPVPGETSITWPAEREETLGSRGGQLEDIQPTLAFVRGL